MYQYTAASISTTRSALAVETTIHDVFDKHVCDIHYTPCVRTQFTYKPMHLYVEGALASEYKPVCLYVHTVQVYLKY